MLQGYWSKWFLSSWLAVLCSLPFSKIRLQLCPAITPGFGMACGNLNFQGNLCGSNEGEDNSGQFLFSAHTNSCKRPNFPVWSPPMSQETLRGILVDFQALSSSVLCTAWRLSLSAMVTQHTVLWRPPRPLTDNSWPRLILCAGSCCLSVELLIFDIPCQRCCNTCTEALLRSLPKWGDAVLIL